MSGVESIGAQQLAAPRPELHLAAEQPARSVRVASPLGYGQNDAGPTRTLRPLNIPPLSDIDPGLLARARKKAGTDEGARLSIRKELKVDGPQVFDPSRRIKQPGFIARAVHQVATWLIFGLREKNVLALSSANLPRTRFAPITAEKFAQLAESGVLKSGDMVVCGNNGHAGHGFVFTGIDRSRPIGDPLRYTITHALASKSSNQTLWERLTLGVADEALRKSGKLGVIHESYAEYVARSPRDTMRVMRFETLFTQRSPDGKPLVESFLRNVRALEGLSYDGALIENDQGASVDRIFCSELFTRALQNTLRGTGLAYPQVATTNERYGQFGATFIGRSISKLIAMDVILATPEDYGMSDSLTRVWETPSARTFFDELESTRVRGPKRVFFG